MSTRQLSIVDFAAHCVDELKSIQHGDTVIEILSSGKVIAVVNPPPVEDSGTLVDWVGSGASLMRYGPQYDPHAPAFESEEWESLNH